MLERTGPSNASHQANGKRQHRYICDNTSCFEVPCRSIIPNPQQIEHRGKKQSQRRPENPNPSRVASRHDRTVHESRNNEQRGAESVESLHSLCVTPCSLCLRLYSFPKNRRPNPHASRSLFNRHFEIVRHAHRKLIHLDGWQLPFRNSIA
jgi:hypothetical protein